QGHLGETLPALREVYLGFTQRSLWDITGNSSPFYDTSYMPELFYQSQETAGETTAGGFRFLGYQAGYRHESNGQAGLASRSLNILYVRPGVAFGRLDGWNLIVAPRLFDYVSDLTNNPDVRTYRGNAEVLIAMGRNDGPGLSVTIRPANKGSVQADLAFPLKSDRLFDFATYFLIQYWNGYGESLRDYNVRSETLRVGVSLVR
ncbi:MAG: phospholipase A, partial [Opitutales bacterium]